MIVRNATPPGASGKVFGFVYSGLDVGSFLAPPVFGLLMSAGLPGIIFWIAVGLYLVNAALVMAIRSTVPTVAARRSAGASYSDRGRRARSATRRGPNESRTAYAAS